MKRLNVVFSLAIAGLIAVVVFLFLGKRDMEACLSIFEQRLAAVEASRDTLRAENRELAQAMVARQSALDSLEIEGREFDDRVATLEMALARATQPISYHNIHVSGSGVPKYTVMSDSTSGQLYLAEIGELPLITELPQGISAGDSVLPITYVSGGREAWHKDPALGLARDRHVRAELLARGLRVGRQDVRYGIEGEHGVLLVKVERPKPQQIVVTEQPQPRRKTNGGTEPPAPEPTLTPPHTNPEPMSLLMGGFFSPEAYAGFFGAKLPVKNWLTLYPAVGIHSYNSFFFRPPSSSLNITGTGDGIAWESFFAPGGLRVKREPALMFGGMVQFNLNKN